jgi:predicted GH43/DUF377 family glycosyl hydrolase
MLRKKKYIVERHPQNPILTAADFPGDIVTAFNGGVIKQGPGKYTMVARVENSALERYMWVCDSTDGLHFTPRPQPVPYPQNDPIYHEYVDGGRQRSYHDPRICEVEGQYYVTHNCHTDYGCQVGLYKVDKRFEKWDWLGLITWPDNRNVVIFPEKIQGKYWRLDRPNVPGAMHIYTGQSPDLIHWGVPRCIVKTRNPTRWAQTKIGPGGPPIKTKEGWLCIIHGVRPQCNDSVYQLGVMLLDLHDPNKVIGVSKRAILAPETTYELIGQTPSCVFTCGSILEDDGTVRIYYGAADTVQCLAMASLDDLLYACKHE